MSGLLAGLLAGDDAALPERAPCGARIERVAPAMWRIEPAASAGRPLIVSAGIHGDETAPVELACAIAEAVAAGALAVRVPWLLALGNLGALRAAKRYLDVDLNRLFGGRHAEKPGSREAPRAAALEGAVAAFCARHRGALHLDLHSAIRASLYRCFAIHPLDEAAALPAASLRLLAACGIEAVVRTGAPSPTFTAHSARARLRGLHPGARPRPAARRGAGRRVRRGRCLRPGTDRRAPPAARRNAADRVPRTPRADQAERGLPPGRAARRAELHAARAGRVDRPRR
ncbi:MAG TPA: succinylglutamate desuccinylase [Myxococcota bacterium]|nr:succinylglutamate desuccinylase [Myxococcota bacterium]